MVGNPLTVGKLTTQVTKRKKALNMDALYTDMNSAQETRNPFLGSSLQHIQRTPYIQEMLR